MANKLEVTLSFKPLMDGLQRFASAIEARLERVRAFNLQIENGSRATNQLVAQAAAALSGAGIASFFTRTIKDGVTFNEELEQARLGIAAVLKQFDSAGKFKTFDDAMAASASAIELLKQKAKESPASFAELVQAFQGTAGAMASANIPLQKQVDLVVSMSQTLAGLGIRSDQILQETRALITGNINADAAAAKILQITSADIAKAKAQGQLYEFLTGKVAAFGEAARRGAQSLTTLRSNFGDTLQQRTAEVAERINDALKRLYVGLTEFAESPAVTTALTMVVDKVAGLLDGVTSVVTALTSLGVGGNIMLSLAGTAGTALLAIVGLLAPLVAIRGIFMHLPTLIQPLRAAFVFIAGVDFVQTLRGLQALSQTYGIVGAMKIATGWERFAAAAAAVGIAFLGYQVGASIIQGLERAALERLEAEDKVRQAAADQLKIYNAQLRAVRAIADAQKTATSIHADLENKSKERDALLEKQRIAEAARAARATLPGMSSVPASTGFSEDDATRLADLEQQMFWLALQLRSAVDQQFVDDQIKRNATADTNGSLQLDPKDRAARDELAERQWLYDQETAIREARLDGNQELLDQLVRERDERQALNDLGMDAWQIVQDRLNVEQEEREKERTAGREKLEVDREQFVLESRALAAELAGNAAAAEGLRDHLRLKQLLRDNEGMTLAQAQERLKVEKDLRAQANQRLAEEQAFSAALGAIGIERATIESDRHRTAEQKQRALLPLLERENQLIAERIALLQEQQGAATPEARLQLQQQIDQLRQEQAGNARARAEAAPQTFGDGAFQGLAGQGGFLDSLGTAAQNAAEAVRGGLNTALQETSNFLYNLATGATSFREAWNQASLAVGQQFLRMITDMVAKMIWRSTVEKALTAVGVTTHVAGETAKTAATGVGVAARLGMMVKEALASVYKGAVQAFESLSSIPYVGPILGAAAMAAALAGGIALVSKIGGHEQGGIVRGGKQLTWINENGEEAVIRNPSLRKFGEPFIERLNAGILDLSSLPDNVARGVALPAMGALANATPAAAPRGAADGGGDGSMEEMAGRITIINVTSPQEARKIARNSAARGDVVRIVNEEFGLPRKR